MTGPEVTWDNDRPDLLDAGHPFTIPAGYVVAVNGEDITVHRTDREGIAGFNRGLRVWRWHEVRRLHLY